MEAARVADPVDTRRRIREAMERRDRAGVVETFAPDIVLRSPIVMGAVFEGRDAVARLIDAIIASFDDYSYTVEADAGDVQVLAFRARVHGIDVDAVDLLTVDERGLVTEIVVHIRPMAGLAAVAAALGPHLARGPVQRVLTAVFTVPLLQLLRLADRAIPRLVRMR